MSCIKVALVYWLRKLNQGFDYNPMAYLWTINEFIIGALFHCSNCYQIFISQYRCSELGMTLRDLVYLCIVSRLSENVWSKMYGILLGLLFWTVFYFSIANANSTLKIRRIHSMPSLSLHSDIYIYYIHVIYNIYITSLQRVHFRTRWFLLIIYHSRILDRIKGMNVRNEQIGNNCVLRTLVRIELVASLQLKLNNFYSDKGLFQIRQNLKCLWKESRPFRRQKYLFIA